MASIKKRSNYGKGCDTINNFFEYEGQFCDIPTGNAFSGSVYILFTIEFFQMCTKNIY